MTKLSSILLFALSMIMTTEAVFSQGCSDAGFCTINSFKPNAESGSHAKKNQFKIGTSLGMADHDISVWSAYVEYNRFLSNKLDFAIKAASLSQKGNGISASGLSDIYLNLNYRLSEKFSVTAGTKLPLADGNKKENGVPLPMDYQSSLGTVDLIIGAGYQINKLQLSAALQQPLSQNDNQFRASEYPGTSPLFNFQTTNGYQRKGDVLLRASYPFDLSPQLKLTPSLLPIYHLDEDEFTDDFGNKHKIPGSQGMTLNGTVYLDYELNANSVLQLNVGSPFFTRDTRPDGLTRSFVATLEYRIRF
mgnify:CR=1 FL=1